ncbi:hypothetical protein K438DRAFT_203443 [Mycena galopus ATCC 62051]|nr:hypothetical protein K438DRAFT_203443 [Mycena galopus ATCC 62051]
MSVNQSRHSATKSTLSLKPPLLFAFYLLRLALINLPILFSFQAKEFSFTTTNAIPNTTLLYQLSHFTGTQTEFIGYHRCEYGHWQLSLDPGRQQAQIMQTPILI